MKQPTYIIINIKIYRMNNCKAQVNKGRKNNTSAEVAAVSPTETVETRGEECGSGPDISSEEAVRFSGETISISPPRMSCK